MKRSPAASRALLLNRSLCHLAPHSVGHPAGFSLMEIILATAMLMGSVIVLARLAGMGRTQANRAELLAEAQLVCETTMTEIVLGMRPLNVVQNQPLLAPEGANPIVQTDEGSIFHQEQVPVDEQSTRWKYSVSTGTVPEHPELNVVTVTVLENRDSDRLVRYSLTRWIRTSNPQPDQQGFLQTGAL